MTARGAIFRGLRRFSSVSCLGIRASQFGRFQPSLCATALRQSTRTFSAESEKLRQLVQGEIQHENSNYESPANIKTFLEKNEWKFIEKEGDVNMTLEKTVDGKKVTVDFQLVSPFETEGEGETQAEMTDFSVTVEKSGGQGITFYCSTLQNDDKFRYMICNVRFFSDEASKNSVSRFASSFHTRQVSTYNGPDFEDLDDSLQATLDEWLGSLGVDGELCDFIDSCSIDKEQREYIFWLKGLEKFLA
ncbi:Mitochondrial glycoprotein, putative [Babesia bigemina]|uniref:Mitochondrial glycoprotein, putative n=1 Tax=Babesia bigemina TaxID=5866 RepID=A0A061DDQ0_BABBI|nr:Mitochondrial glycoprotein, putative [Babesia bigemina]CDR96455.1 Mitochondrial glycoprotein, putative [Babesia bigemina]|eukprot:XP_012768641.1 Mitochondrial glycoprotein, putative [Babesia bigemina]